MVRIWYDKDVPADSLKEEVVAVIGYGSQGQAQASNMKDSGVNVIVGVRKGGKGWDAALKEGHKVKEVADATREASIIHILIPDMVQGDVYANEIAPNLDKGKALTFSHGAAINWNWIKPPEWIDIMMVAPKSPGQRLREVFVQNFGTPALVAVDQDYTGKALSRILGMTRAIGCTKVGAIETTFKEEVDTDWFGEQVDLCGGVDRLIRNSFETLVEGGYQPEIAYFECLHELKLIVDLVQRFGIAGMYRRCSETARYGGLTVGGAVLDDSTKQKMKIVLDNIRSGVFEKDWVSSYKKEGQRAFDRYLEELDSHQVEITGKKLRSMMWPNEQVS